MLKSPDNLSGLFISAQIQWNVIKNEIIRYILFSCLMVFEYAGHFIVIKATMLYMKKAYK